MPKSPVFIVGSPRSGTSILVDAMITLGYMGFREGNFLTLLTTISNAVDRHFKIFGSESPHVLVSQIDPNALKEKISLVFAEMTDQLNPSKLWFDKSGNPEMIQAIPVLKRLWPDSVFIFAKRRAIENIISRQKKFPKMAFEYHCSDWASNMSSWRSMREALSNDIFIEIDQQDLLLDPDRSADKIIQLLGLDGHLRERLLNTFSKNRPQQTDEGSAAKTYAFDDVDWSESQKKVFLERCKPEMVAYGYSLEASYWE